MCNQIMGALFGGGGYGQPCPTCGCHHWQPYYGYGQPMQPPGGLAPGLEEMARAMAQQQDAHRKAWKRMEEKDRYKELVRRSAYRKGWVERLKEVFR